MCERTGEDACSHDSQKHQSPCLQLQILLYDLFGLAYDIRSVYIPIQNKIKKKFKI